MERFLLATFMLSSVLFQGNSLAQDQTQEQQQQRENPVEQLREEQHEFYGNPEVESRDYDEEIRMRSIERQRNYLLEDHEIQNIPQEENPVPDNSLQEDPIPDNPLPDKNV